MKIIATIKRSNGNESVGDMWTETKVFDDTSKLADIVYWLDARQVQFLTTNVVLSVSQQEAKP